MTFHVNIESECRSKTRPIYTPPLVDLRLTWFVQKSCLIQLDLSILVEIGSLQVSSHGRQGDSDSIQILGHTHLAAQTRGLGEAKCQIQHVVLIIIRLLQLVVVLGVHNHVASGAGTRSATSALHVQIVGLCNVQQIVALARVNLNLLTVLGDEGDLDFLARLGLVHMTVENGSRGLEKTRGRGNGSERPWNGPGNLQNLSRERTEHYRWR